ncbi:MAG: hypothetical protein IV100_32400 [Myxococcales bacterium]|nr:hypothetical protein [Myxococcales bacterium]
MSHYVFISAPGSDPALLECWNAIAGGTPTESIGERPARRNEQGVTVVEVDGSQTLSQIGKFLAEEPEKAQSVTIVGHAYPGVLVVAGKKRIELTITRDAAAETVTTRLSWTGRSQLRSRLAADATIHLIGCSLARDIPGEPLPLIGEGAELIQAVASYFGRPTTGSLCAVLASSLAPNPGAGPGLTLRFEGDAPKPARPPDPELTPLCPVGTAGGETLAVGKPLAELLTQLFGPFDSSLFDRPVFDFSRRLIAPVRRLEAHAAPTGALLPAEVRYYRDEDRDYVGVIDDSGSHVAIELTAAETKRVIAVLPPTFTTPPAGNPTDRRPDGPNDGAPG